MVDGGSSDPYAWAMRSLSLLLALLLTWLLTSCAGVGAAAGVSGRASGSKGPLEYDFQGWRTRTISPTEDRTYVWGVDGIEAEGPTGGALAQHTRGAGMTLAVGNEVFGHDALGSVVMRVPTNGAATRTAYDAWGAVRATPSTGPPLGGTGDRVGFTGHSNEPTGLIYAQQRWLDPTTGRFLSLDPVQGELAMPLSTQGWTYANGMPTRFIDPDGRAGAPIHDSERAARRQRKSREEACETGDVSACNQNLFEDGAKAFSFGGHHWSASSNHL